MTPRAREVLTILETSPGVNLRGLARRLGVHETVAEHHLNMLEREGLAYRIASPGRPTLAYPVSRPVPAWQRERLKLGAIAFYVDAVRLADRPVTAREVMAMLLTSEGATRRALERAVHEGHLVKLPGNAYDTPRKHSQ